jgi:hypothetical protein
MAADVRPPKEDTLKRQILAGLGAALSAAVLVLIPAPARADQIRCQVPFSFTVRGKTLPPGIYTFSYDSQAMLVRGYTDGAVVLTNRLDSRTEMDAKAVFEKDGDEYILKETWMGGGVGRELLLPKTNGERRPSTESRVEQVVVPAL